MDITAMMGSDSLIPELLKLCNVYIAPPENVRLPINNNYLYVLKYKKIKFFYKIIIFSRERHFVLYYCVLYYCSLLCIFLLFCRIIFQFYYN